MWKLHHSSGFCFEWNTEAAAPFPTTRCQYWSTFMKPYCLLMGGEVRVWGRSAPSLTCSSSASPRTAADSSFSLSISLFPGERRTFFIQKLHIAVSDPNVCLWRYPASQQRFLILYLWFSTQSSFVIHFISIHSFPKTCLDCILGKERKQRRALWHKTVTTELLPGFPD